VEHLQQSGSTSDERFSKSRAGWTIHWAPICIRVHEPTPLHISAIDRMILSLHHGESMCEIVVGKMCTDLSRAIWLDCKPCVCEDAIDITPVCAAGSVTTVNGSVYCLSRLISVQDPPKAWLPHQHYPQNRMHTCCYSPTFDPHTWCGQIWPRECTDHVRLVFHHASDTQTHQLKGGHSPQDKGTRLMHPSLQATRSHALQSQLEHACFVASSRTFDRSGRDQFRTLLQKCLQKF